MLQRIKRWSCLAVLAAVLLAGSAGSAETVRGDLTDRFSSIPQLTYQEKEYIQRGQMTSALFIGLGPDQEGQVLQAEYLVVIVADDALRQIRLVQLPEDVQVDGTSLMDGLGTEGELQEKCLRLVATVNRLMPGEMIDHYIALNADGLKRLEDAGQIEAEDYQERLKQFKAYAEGLSGDALSDLFTELSPYIRSDMKSGALMKLVNKAEKFDRQPTLTLSAEETVPGAEKLDEVPAYMDELIHLFYEEKKW